MNWEEVEILLVEDNDEELALHSLRRQEMAKSIFAARDGEEALDFLFCRGRFAERSFENPPKMVLLDCKLSKIDGIEVLRQVKNDPRTKTIPVVIMTSAKEDRDLVSGYQLGTNSYIQKPVDFDQLQQAVASVGIYWLVINQRLKWQLLEAQEKYRDIVENAVVGIFQSTPAGRYLRVNPAMAIMLGYDSPQELIANITDIGRQVYADPTSREEFKRVAREKGVVKNFECQARRKDGSKMWLSASARAIFEDGVLVRYEGTNEDVTRRKELEAQLHQAQKMEALGLLASGLAHDFNNTLGIINGYSDLLQKTLPPEAASHSYAAEINKAGNRAANLIRQLLAFGRKQVIQPIVLDLNQAIGEFDKMIRRLIGENIEITFKESPGLGSVKIDPGQVEQILMNLAANSRDAMPQGGKLCIETANVELDETYARQNLYVKPGSYVMMSVSDTGCGMDKETQLQAFTPFFTTKESGKGSGLGLSTVYGIVKQNQGYVMVYSEPGKGTTLRLYLPRLADAPSLHLPLPVLKTVPRGTETVLLVEDEEALRTLARICLEGNHYFVLDAPNAAAALEVARKHEGRIHLLLTDVVMPGMSGRELAIRLIPSHPEIRVLYMSGYTNDLIAQNGILDSDVVLLEKPFTLNSLLAKVHNALHIDQSVNEAAS